MRVLTLSAIVALAACTDKAPPLPKPAAVADTWTDPSPHQSRFVQVNGVSLNVLDWGGTGDGLVLIHGMSDSPHSFDDVAPALTDGHHVIAYARRGHGQSDHPAAGPYDNETLVEDLRQLLDSLGIKRAVLGGWSMGGNEITRFAERYPERAAGIIYRLGDDLHDDLLRRATEVRGLARQHLVEHAAERVHVGAGRDHLFRGGLFGTHVVRRA